MIRSKKQLKFVILLSLTIIDSTSIKAQDYLNSKYAFDYFLKVADVEKNNFKVEYFYVNSGKVYDKIWDNEFELNEKVKAQDIRMMNDIGQIENDFWLELRTDFGEYNFDDKGFRLNLFQKDPVSFIKTGPFGKECLKCKTSTDIDVQFNNSSHINSFPLAEL